MSDEPSNWELARQLQDIKQMLGGVVGHPEYAADKTALNYRFEGLERAIASERSERSEDIKAVNGRLDAQAKDQVEHRMHWRSWLLTGVLPAFVAAIGILVAILLARHGGGGHG